MFFLYKLPQKNKITSLELVFNKNRVTLGLVKVITAFAISEKIMRSAASIVSAVFIVSAALIVSVVPTTSLASMTSIIFIASVTPIRNDFSDNKAPSPFILASSITKSSFYYEITEFWQFSFSEVFF